MLVRAVEIQREVEDERRELALGRDVQRQRAGCAALAEGQDMGVLGLLGDVVATVCALVLLAFH